MLCKNNYQLPTSSGNTLVAPPMKSNRPATSTVEKDSVGTCTDCTHNRRVSICRRDSMPIFEICWRDSHIKKGDSLSAWHDTIYGSVCWETHLRENQSNKENCCGCSILKGMEECVFAIRSTLRRPRKVFTYLYASKSSWVVANYCIGPIEFFFNKCSARRNPNPTSVSTCGVSGITNAFVGGSSVLYDRVHRTTPYILWSLWRMTPYILWSLENRYVQY